MEFEGEFVSAACSYIKHRILAFVVSANVGKDGVLCEWSNACPT